MYNEKILSLEEVWKESGGEISSKTFQEFVRMGKRIEKAERRRRSGWIISSVLTIVASVAAVILVGISLARRRYPCMPPGA